MNKQSTIITMVVALVFFGFVSINYGQEHTLPNAAVTDVQSCLPTGQIRMNSWVGQRMDDCMENLITAWDPYIWFFV